MCCSFTPSKMSDTHLYVGEAEKDGKTVHVLAYQNTAKSSGPNAMVIPFPTDMAMGPANVIDTSAFKSFLKDISDASMIVSKGFNSALIGSRSLTSSRGIAQVFDVGSYTVILAENVSQIKEALKKVVPEKRPEVSKNFLYGYDELYPHQPIAICCWNGSVKAEPLMWWYEPRDTKTLFIPTMDAHDGQAPNVDSLVSTDHIISVGSVGPTDGSKVFYNSINKIPSQVMDLLPSHVHGMQMKHREWNGDSFVKTASLHEGIVPKLVRGLGKNATEFKMAGWFA